MSDKGYELFIMKELSALGDKLSNKMDGINDNVTDVRIEVEGIKQATEVRLDEQQRCIMDLKQDREDIWEKVHENSLSIAVTTERMDNTEVPTSEEFEDALNDATPFIRKLLERKFSAMSAKEKAATTGIGGAGLLGFLVFLNEVGPTIAEFIRPFLNL